MKWNLYQNENFLKPLCFSNGKTQEDIVKETLDLIHKGKKIIFIHGVCGTGKSAIALNLAKELGKASIVVPGKNLQAQYKKDYEGSKYLLKNNKEKLKISVITGRKNHKCKFLEDNELVPKIKKEVNSKLYDIFSKREENVEKDLSADNKDLPCKIELREGNWSKIKEYLKQNKNIDLADFTKISDVKRVSIASVCPYWSPVLPDKYDFKSLKESKQRRYLGLGGTQYIQYKRKFGCPFYEQFDSYLDSDVIVFNSLKYKLETALNRKPKTEVEIIDECDEFLDSLSNQRNINIERLQNSLIQALGSEESEKIEELLELIKHLKKDKNLSDAIIRKEILPIKRTGIYDILKVFLKEDWMKYLDDESYLFDVLETAKMFRGFMEETYVIPTKKDNVVSVGIVTINLAKKLKEYVEKNNCLVLMSGTIHSKEVLETIFGLNNFEIIEAETRDQGTIEIKRTGLEMDCKYSNFKEGGFTREDYLLALDKSIEVGKKPILVHVNAFQDIPDKEEIKKYNLKNLISREELREMQDEDKEGKLISEFKEGKREILFSTRDSRGIDFPGSECRSIVFTKYPNPNVDDPFWKILMKTKPNYYWAFYRDKARREFLQKIYRGLRFKEDHIYLLSPDIRVLDTIEKDFKDSFG